MRVVVDARKLGDNGIGVYIENLIVGLLQLNVSNLGLALLVGPNLTPRARSRFHQAGIKLADESSGLYSLGEYFWLPRRHRTLLSQADIYHSPHYTLPFLGDFAPRLKQIVTVHDIIHLTHPENVMHRMLARPLIGSALKRADKVITVSAASQSAIEEHFPNAADKIQVVHNALRSGFYRSSDAEISEGRSRLKLPERFFLFVGSGRPHKGLQELISAFATYRRRCTELDIPQVDLVVIGGRINAALPAELDRLNLREHVHFTSATRVEDLRLMYSAAEAVVLPSRVEGFGLVALEALACGAPLVSTPLASVREVAAEAAWYSQSLAAEDIAAAMTAVMLDETSRREKARRGMERAQQFSILRTASETYKIYEELLEKAAPRKMSPTLVRQAGGFRQ